SQLLVVRDGLREHTWVHIREEPLLRPGNLGGRGRADPLSRLPVSAHELPRLRLLEPLSRCCQAAEGYRPEHLAHGCHNVRDLLVLELLRVRALLMEIGALALTPGSHHVCCRAGI